MIPGTLLGLVALAAALGPGYIFVRRAQRHSNRPAQSQLSELVEMVVIGGTASLVAAGIVLATVDVFDALNTTELRKDPAAYILDEPIRVFLAAAAFYGLAYGGAYLAALIGHRDRPPAIERGGTGWGQAFSSNRPDGKAVTVTIELKDGRKIAGGLKSFTPGSQANREIVLVQPLAGTMKRGGRQMSMSDHFVVLREDQIAVISGVYGD